jgi:hypothetical protein
MVARYRTCFGEERWGTDRVMIEDEGDVLVRRPLPDDPIGAALELFEAGGPATDDIRAQMREDDAIAEARRFGGES